jgi:hypothetical protein
MGNQRTSNKDIASKLDTLIELLTAQSMAQNQTPTVSVQPTVAEPQPAKQDSVKIDAKYLAKMEPKWQAYANKLGQTVVGYAYRKSNGKVGLWGCPSNEVADVSARESFIGCIKEVHPS